MYEYFPLRRFETDCMTCAIEILIVLVIVIAWDYFASKARRKNNLTNNEIPEQVIKGRTDEPK